MNSVKIGLTHTGNPEKNQYYVDWLKANEALEIIQLSVNDDNLEAINECDALVLSGGIDIHPKYYGNAITGYPGAPEKFKEQRDEFEIAAFHLSLEKKLPVLGICRGMQLINVIHQGTLIQNLGDDTLNKVHKGNPDKSHEVIVSKGTLLYDIVGTEKTEINSAHHQAIDKVGKGLRVNARSPEGVAEGIEWADAADKPFLLAVQWHPERMFRFHLQNSPASKAIRERFISEVKKSRSSKK